MLVVERFKEAKREQEQKPFARLLLLISPVTYKQVSTC